MIIIIFISGFCMKSRTDGGDKIFINVCQSENVSISLIILFFFCVWYFAIQWFNLNILTSKLKAILHILQTSFIKPNPYTHTHRCPHHQT